MKEGLGDLSAWSADEARRLGLQNLLSKRVIGRVHSGLGGSHTVVTYPPLDALVPIDSDSVMAAVRPVKGLNLYAHVAFCEHLCPFCHYAKTYSPIGEEDELVRSYLDALLLEAERWAELLAGSTVSSVYVGGGTPTAISTSRLVEVLERLCRLPKNPGFEMCVETSPLTTVAAGGWEKLLVLRAAGVNRFSIGVQTFDDKLLRRTRGHGLYEAEKAVTMLRELGVDFNVDLMQDLPHQTEQSLITDLSWIDALRPHQVTWYLLRVHPQSPWFLQYERGDLELPPASDSARRRVLIREGMRRIGYVPRPGGRFVRNAAIRDRFKEVRAGSDETLVGMGVSAYSHGWGYFFRNSFFGPMDSGIHGYVEQIHQAGLAVESGLHLDATEVIAGKVVVGIRRGIRLPEPEPATKFYLDETAATLHLLQDAGLVDQDASGTWSLTECGWAFEEEVCSLFYTDGVKQQLSQTGSYWASSSAPAVQSWSRGNESREKGHLAQLKRVRGAHK